jgi:hypothetical protein
MRRAALMGRRGSAPARGGDPTVKVRPVSALERNAKQPSALCAKQSKAKQSPMSQTVGRIECSVLIRLQCAVKPRTSTRWRIGSVAVVLPMNEHFRVKVTHCTLTLPRAAHRPFRRSPR